MSGRLGAIAILVIALTLSSGCGGARSDTEAGEPGAGGCERLAGESEREDCERAEAAARVPAADRAAYYQLATTTGLLRAASVAAQSDDPRPAKAGAAELTAARERLEKASPRDPALRAARRRLLALLAGASREPGRREARRELAALAGVERHLAAYLRRAPANASLLPD